MCLAFQCELDVQKSILGYAGKCFGCVCEVVTIRCCAYANICRQADTRHPFDFELWANGRNTLLQEGLGVGLDQE